MISQAAAQALEIRTESTSVQDLRLSETELKSCYQMLQKDNTVTEGAAAEEDG